MAEDSGRILWSKESKHYLLSLIKQHSVIINPNVSSETMLKKEMAWLSIEQSFAADGMPCQLSKLKRLWKRMKDNARQNTLKLSEQKSRGIKNIKAPSELDWQVHNLLAGRKNDGRSRGKPMLHKSPTKSSQSHPPTQRHRNTKQKCDVVNVKEEDAVSDADGSNDVDLESDTELVDLLTPHQQYQQSAQRNGFHDALEPMTIIEEFGRRSNAAPMADDDEAVEEDDEYSFSRHVTSSANLDPDGYDPAEIKQMQRELLLHDIQLKLIQRQNEDERMSNERELFRKQSILLDLQTTKAKLELARLQPNQSDTVSA